MAVEEATAAEFRTRFPELSSTTDAVVERLLEEAEIIHITQPLATLYLAAHLAAKYGDAQSGQSTGGVGEITGEYAASLRVQYSSIATDKEARNRYFASTDYGARFLVLEARTPKFALGMVVA